MQYNRNKILEILERQLNRALYKQLQNPYNTRPMDITCVPWAAPTGTPVSPSCLQSAVSLPEIHLQAHPGGQSEEEEGEGEAGAASVARKATSTWRRARRHRRRAIISPPSVVVFWYSGRLRGKPIISDNPDMSYVLEFLCSWIDR